jgi:hypothetical protein
MENLGKTISRVAGESLASKQYSFVKLNSSGQVVAAGDGNDAIGVLQNDPASGDIAVVMVGTGITKVLAGGSSTVGYNVGSDASGRAVTAASGDYLLGQFLTAPTGAGQVVDMLFQKGAATL